MAKDYHEYLRMVEESKERYPQLRDGQAHYNALYEYDPPATILIEDAGLDPFYHDERIRPMRAFLRTHWLREAKRERE